MRKVGKRSEAPARGLDNLLYSADVDFSCFADLALVRRRSACRYDRKGPPRHPRIHS